MLGDCWKNPKESLKELQSTQNKIKILKTVKIIPLKSRNSMKENRTRLKSESLKIIEIAERIPKSRKREIHQRRRCCCSSWWFLLDRKSEDCKRLFMNDHKRIGKQPRRWRSLLLLTGKWRKTSSSATTTSSASHILRSIWLSSPSGNFNVC